MLMLNEESYGIPVLTRMVSVSLRASPWLNVHQVDDEVWAILEPPLLQFDRQHVKTVAAPTGVTLSPATRAIVAR